jgi:hypothetical protein
MVPGNVFGEPPDPFFRPAWEDAPDETNPPRLRRQTAPPGDTPLAEAAALLAPLALAQDALARLDARAAAAAAPLRDGLIARLAFREAAGCLAAEHAWVHPHDLALRDLRLTGGFDAAVRAGAPAHALPNTTASGSADWDDSEDPLAPLRDEAGVPPALRLARLLRHLPRRHNPLAAADTAAALLAPLGGEPPEDFDPDRFARWHAAFGPPGRGRAPASATPPLPPLLTAAAAAQGWMAAGISPRPAAIQALAVAALRLARADTPRIVPLPVWGAWPAIGQLDPGGLPRLRHSVAAKLTGGDGESWAGRFLHLVAESARAGLRELDRLEAAAGKGAALTADLDVRSRLPDALEAALRTPALTPRRLAQRLRVTPQAATRLLATLADTGIVAEITGRKSFRAFAV